MSILLEAFGFEVIEKTKQTPFETHFQTICSNVFNRNLTDRMSTGKGSGCTLEIYCNYCYM